jgi:hypothetical protein
MSAARRWDNIPKCQQKSGYWFAVPDNPDNILDGMDYEIVYVYFDGKRCVMRPGESKRESLDNFGFVSLVDDIEIN